MDEKTPQKNVVYPRGTYLFRRNDPSHELYIVKRGKLKIFKTEGDVEIEFDEAGPGEVIGELAALDGGLRTASVVAIEDTEVFVIPYDDFQKIVRQIPDWLKKITMILVQRLREVDSKIDFRMNGDKSVHAAALLWLMSAARGAGSPQTEVSLKNYEDELFDILNVPLADSEKILETLAKNNLITIDKNKIIISNYERLEQFCKPVFEETADALLT